MPGASAVAVVLGGLVALWGCARLIVRVATDPGAIRPSSEAASQTVAAALVGVALALTAPATGQPMYWAAAAVAALSTAAAVGLAREIGSVFGEPAYALPTLSITATDAPGSISAAAGLAAAVGALATAALAFQVRMIGPSDAGLIAFAAFFAMLFERWLAGVWKPPAATRWAPGALAALGGAGLASGFIALLP